MSADSAIYRPKIVEVEPLAVDAVGAAKLLGLSSKTVRALAAAGTLPSKRVGGVKGRLLFSVAKLREWIDSPQNIDSPSAAVG
jgi:excisionase family DNA binding protein